MQAASPSCLREHRTGQQELPGRRMKEMNSDTIAAVSTAMSPAGIGIVRISSLVMRFAECIAKAVISCCPYKEPFLKA